eukprot:364003-Chlamydomonas_euryale.AAC.1
MHAGTFHQVWSVNQPEWACKIDEGPAGIAAAAWSPDGHCVLSHAQHGVRTAVWSLAERRCHYLAGAKVMMALMMLCSQMRLGSSVLAQIEHTITEPPILQHTPCPEHSTAFSPDGVLYAQLERYDCADHISIYDTRTWQRRIHFQVGSSLQQISTTYTFN